MNRAGTHPDDDELVLAADGELPARRRAILDAHLGGCSACRARLAGIESTLAAANALCASEHDGHTLPPQYGRLRLDAALREAAGEWDQSWLTRVRWAVVAAPARAALAVAAALLLVMAPLVGSRLASPVPEAGAALPITALTPGAVSAHTVAELCAGERPSRVVAEDTRRQVLRSYDMEEASTRSYELDALITPELGGTTDPRNLWPQPYESPIWNARVKDELERLLPALVCSRQVELARAQQDIATDWVAAYKRYFRTDVPLRAHVGPPLADDDDVLIGSVEPVHAGTSSPIPLRVAFMRR